jgi:hypothetical protein
MSVGVECIRVVLNFKRQCHKTFSPCHLSNYGIKWTTVFSS